MSTPPSTQAKNFAFITAAPSGLDNPNSDRRFRPVTSAHACTSASEMSNSQINRMIAKLAARNCNYRGQSTPAALMAEAYMTDKFHCSENEMAKLLDAEWRKVRGQSLGGHVSAIVKKQSGKTAKRGVA